MSVDSLLLIEARDRSNFLDHFCAAKATGSVVVSELPTGLDRMQDLLLYRSSMKDEVSKCVSLDFFAEDILPILEAQQRLLIAISDFKHGL